MLRDLVRSGRDVLGRTWTERSPAAGYRRGKAIRIALIALCGLVALTLYSPLDIGFIYAGLDPSWVAALVRARELNLDFGRDVTFSFGPLFHMYTHSFAPTFMVEKLLTAGLFTAFLVAVMAIGAREIGALLLVTAVLALSLLHDEVFAAIPLIACLVLTLPLSRPQSLILLLLAAPASAAAALVKFPAFPMALAGFVLVDAVSLARRRLPLGLGAYLLSLYAIYHVVSPADASLTRFIRAALDFSAGYADAMAKDGPWPELVVIFVIAVALVGVAIRIDLKDPRLDANSAAAGARVILLLVYIFVIFKAGLVRHDGHTIIAWQGLALAAALYYVVLRPTPRSAATIALLLIVGVASLGGGIRVVNLGISAQTFLAEAVLRPGRELVRWFDFVIGPRQWFAEQIGARERARAQLAAQFPLPALPGSVDMIQSNQSLLIANELRYRPRPSVQEYASFTHALIQRNAGYYKGKHAPEYVFIDPAPVAIGSIDGRHPALSEGPQWPLLLSRYAPETLVGGQLLLKRRATPIESRLKVYRSIKTGWGKTTALVPPKPGAIFARIDIEPNILGSLARLLFKSALVDVVVRYSDGRRTRHRIIPAIAREGFFITPLVTSATDFGTLATGRAETLPRQATKFSIETSLAGRWFYKGDIGVKLALLDGAPLRAAAQEATATGLWSVLLQNPPQPPAYQATAEGLFAHAPRQLKLETKSRRDLQLGFGIIDGAWQGDTNTDGVCFRVTAKDLPAPIWERCLTPKTVAGDRGVQSAQVLLPSGTEEIVLETACGKTCARDWAYWSQVSLK